MAEFTCLECAYGLFGVNCSERCNCTDSDLYFCHNEHGCQLKCTYCNHKPPPPPPVIYSKLLSAIQNGPIGQSYPHRHFGNF